MGFKRLVDYIPLVDNRNKGLKVTDLLGINITKNFMPLVANVSGTDLSKYNVGKRTANAPAIANLSIHSQSLHSFPLPARYFEKRVFNFLYPFSRKLSLVFSEA